MHITFSASTFYFVVTGIRPCIWQAKPLNIGVFNLANVHYANIGVQIKFIDTIKYYQQSLVSLPYSADDTTTQKKGSIRRSYQKFLAQNSTYFSIFNSFLDENQNWVLDYFSDGNGVKPYEKIKSCDDLDAAP